MDHNVQCVAEEALDSSSTLLLSQALEGYRISQPLIGRGGMPALLGHGAWPFFTELSLFLSELFLAHHLTFDLTITNSSRVI